MSVNDIFRIAFLALFIAFAMMSGFRNRVSRPVQISDSAETGDTDAPQPLQPSADGVAHQHSKSA